MLVASSADESKRNAGKPTWSFIVSAGAVLGFATPNRDYRSILELETGAGVYVVYTCIPDLPNPTLEDWPGRLEPYRLED